MKKMLSLEEQCWNDATGTFGGARLSEVTENEAHVQREAKV